MIVRRREGFRYLDDRRPRMITIKLQVRLIVPLYFSLLFLRQSEYSLCRCLKQEGRSCFLHLHHIVISNRMRNEEILKQPYQFCTVVISYVFRYSNQDYVFPTIKFWMSVAIISRHLAEVIIKQPSVDLKNQPWNFASKLIVIVVVLIHSEMYIQQQDEITMCIFHTSTVEIYNWIRVLHPKEVKYLH